MRIVVVVLAVALSTAGAEAQECIDSPSGRFSASVGETHPSSRCIAGWTEVVLHAGSGCDPAAVIARGRGGGSFGVTDGGVLVTTLGRRIRRRDWDVVHLVILDGTGQRFVRLTLDELPGTEVLTGLVEVVLTADAVVFANRRAEVRVAFTTLDAIVAAR